MFQEFFTSSHQKALYRLLKGPVKSSDVISKSNLHVQDTMDKLALYGHAKNQGGQWHITPEGKKAAAELLKAASGIREGWEKGKFWVEHPKTKEDHKTNYDFHVRNMKGHDEEGNWQQVEAHKRLALKHGKLAGIDQGDMWMDNVSER